MAACLPLSISLPPSLPPYFPPSFHLPPFLSFSSPFSCLLATFASFLKLSTSGIQSNPFWKGRFQEVSGLYPHGSWVEWQGRAHTSVCRVRWGKVRKSVIFKAISGQMPWLCSSVTSQQFGRSPPRLLGRLSPSLSHQAAQRPGLWRRGQKAAVPHTGSLLFLATSHRPAPQTLSSRPFSTYILFRGHRQVLIQPERERRFFVSSPNPGEPSVIREKSAPSCGRGLTWGCVTRSRDERPWVVSPELQVGSNLPSFSWQELPSSLVSSARAGATRCGVEPRLRSNWARAAREGAGAQVPPPLAACTHTPTAAGLAERGRVWARASVSASVRTPREPLCPLLAPCTGHLESLETWTGLKYGMLRRWFLSRRYPRSRCAPGSALPSCTSCAWRLGEFRGWWGGRVS